MTTKKPEPKPASKGGYDARRDREAASVRASSRDGREIGPLPRVASWVRRNRCGLALLDFLKAYFPETFPLPWSDDHREAVGAVERVVREGGLFTLAMPRGSGKTSIAVRAALWAILYGYRRFVVLLAAEQGLADNLAAVIRAELQFNDLLAGDFPEVCHPVRRLENITKRQQGQTLGGHPTMLKLAAGEIVFPTVRADVVKNPRQRAASGAVVRSVGITGSVRGQIATTAEGETLRPDLVLSDDPQTRESAKSPTQVSYRLSLLNADVLGLAGPGKKIACMNLVTVVYPADLADKLLDREAHPEWQGRRYSLLKSLPADLDWWDGYAEVRRQSLREHGDNRAGNALYSAERERADRGAVAGWPERFNPDEVSAVQHAMNVRIDRPHAFASEFQNQPLAEALAAGAKEVDPRAVAARVNGLGRFDVPPGCSRVTAGVDVGGDLLWYTVAAWNDQFGGSVLDYGCYPPQARGVFAASDARPSLKDVFPGMTEAQRAYAGLQALLPQVLGRAYPAGAAGELRAERCLVDAGWQPDAVYQFVQASPFAGVVYPSKGVGRSTSQAGVAKWKPRPGERSGYHWRLSLGTGGGRGRQVQFDPDAWKSVVWGALAVPPGGPQGLTLWGTEGQARGGLHELFAAHCAAETSEPATLRGDTFDKWQVRPDRPDNHLWDTLVLAAVAASVQGLQLKADGTAGGPPAERKKVKLSELMRTKQHGGG